MSRLILLAAVAATAISFEANSATAANFDPRVVTLGSEREQLKSMPIESRPNRPLHIYGNSIRRRHARAVETSPKGNPQR